ncbi:hypothetical protein OHC33_009846 [Knufia fluminis]|uniref:glutathione transferase n=1 Tax=Knufia fluminis TaxID=191047 RepID=A0AAN8EA99_9EURO|nr:hypothetical protein OHC33_009846 [Knufia fluminis]
MSDLKPIKLYSHAAGPNPWRVVMVLKELNLPYTEEFVEFSNIKSEPYISTNPNGRVPAIDDPNTNITLWESGAILQYLVQAYDKDHKISFPTGSKESFFANQWLFFQASGQGPYYGQAAWFSNFHPEKLPSVIERYQKEAMRVVGVIDSHLKKHNLKYLVPDEQNPEGKPTYADIAFVPWGVNVGWLMGKDVFADGEYPAYKGWFDRVTARAAVKEALDHKASLTKH